MTKAEILHAIIMRDIHEMFSKASTDEELRIMQDVLDLKELWQKEYRENIASVLLNCLSGNTENEEVATMFDYAAEAYRYAFYCDGVVFELMEAQKEKRNQPTS